MDLSSVFSGRGRRWMDTGRWILALHAEMLPKKLDY